MPYVFVQCPYRDLYIVFNNIFTISRTRGDVAVSLLFKRVSVHNINGIKWQPELLKELNDKMIL